VEQNDPLYYMKYGPFVLATVRPETKFGDTAVAVHPQDKRYTDWIGKHISFDGLTGPVTLKVVADEAVNPAFGTGVVKVTPAHDMTDYEIGKRHDLPMKQAIGFDGKLTSLAGPYQGLRVKAARAKIVEDLQAKNLIEKIDSAYIHTVGTCYRCGLALEPLPMTQWFVKIRPLAKSAIQKIKDKKITFIPKRFEKQGIRWLTDFHDWNISRQIVWGIRIPAWKCASCNQWTVTDGEPPKACTSCSSTKLEQETDTFDTWFSSGQWPFATLKAVDAGQNDTNTKKHSNFDYFYPTSVMETGYDILPWWVSRMIMLGIYVTGKIPFSTVYLHGLVRDQKGQKMSKSKGNVINPIDMVDKYGADALRMTLVFGTKAGNDQSFSEDKIRGMRNFGNKLWNMTRLLLMDIEASNIKDLPSFDKKRVRGLSDSDTLILSKLDALVETVTKDMEKYRFSDAAQSVYEFAWHECADIYLEENKKRFANGDIQSLVTFRHLLVTILKLIHPFMPFISEAIYQKIPGLDGTPLIISSWPKRD